MALDFDLSLRLTTVRGITESEFVELTSPISVIVGRNNVGKTRILESIRDASALLTGGVRIRVRRESICVELEADISGGAQDYIVTHDDTETYRLNLSEHPNGHWILRLPTGASNVGGGFGQKPGLPAILGTLRSYPDFGGQLVTDALSRIVYLPPLRAIPSVVSTTPVRIPAPSGADLANAIYTQLNERTPAFEEFRSVIQAMFPEVDDILTRPIAQHRVALTVHDRYSRQMTQTDQCGTGLSQILHLVGSVLFSEPGRVFLIDEPHVFLHPGVERLLVDFLKRHPEHVYFCATHSPVFINAAEPEDCWLVTRDPRGTAIRSVFSSGLRRREILAELGIQPGDVALAERILFVEGVADRDSFRLILDKLGWNPERWNCAVISMGGSGTTRSVLQVAAQLSSVLETPYLICLDGDARVKYSPTADPHIVFLDADELEGLFLSDPRAVLVGLSGGTSGADGAPPASVSEDWTVNKVAEVLKSSEGKKPSDRLSSLARHMGLSYKKAVHGPAIAAALNLASVLPLKSTLAPLFARAAGVAGDESDDAAQRA